MQKLGVRFPTPSGWTCEYLPDQEGFLLIAPAVEANWQANLFLEVQKNPVVSLLQGAQQLSKNLGQLKNNYREVAVEEGQTGAGMTYASVECTHVQEQTPLTEIHFIIQLPTGHWLIISATIASALDAKYRPRIRSFLDAISA